jgi:hypothetical protein
MAQRQSTRKILSDEVQGAGSYVMLRALEYGLIEERMKLDADDRGAILEFNREFVKAIVVDWNWVDDAGEPLALPADDPAVISRLVMPEFEWLANASGLNQAAEEKKA